MSQQFVVVAMRFAAVFLCLAFAALATSETIQQCKQLRKSGSAEADRIVACYEAVAKDTGVKVGACVLSLRCQLIPVAAV